MARTKAEDKVVSAVGSPDETNGLVSNEAAKSVSHMLGEDIARDLGDTLEALKTDPQKYSMVFNDMGLRLKAVKAISEKARVTDFPTDETAVYIEFEQFMNYCDAFMIAPTLGLYAGWMGVSLETFEDKLAHYRTARPDVANALELCKELLRGFLETKALDGTVAPAIYLHQNKAYYKAVETAPARRSAEVDGHVRDPQRLAEVINLLPD